MKVTKSFLVIALALMATVAFSADWYGTHPNEKGETDWGDAANWNSATGVPQVNVDFKESVIVEKGGSKTVTFSDARQISGDLHLYAGTEAAPLVFKSSGANGLAMTANKQAYVGSGAAYPAYVVLDGGTYTFVNDLNVAWNQSAGALVVKEGTTVLVPYWSFISGGSGGAQPGRVVIDGGEFASGYRDGGEQNNGRFNIADGGSSTAKLVVKSGRFRCSKNTNGGNQSEALCIANGGSSNGSYEHLGGNAVVDGFLYVGKGGSSTATMTLSDGEVKVNGQFVVADGNGSTGTYVQDGGTLISTAYLCIGSIHNDSYTADFTLNGGVVQNTGNVVTMGSRGTAGSMATLTINGGIFSSVSDLWIGENGSATVNLNGGVADFSNGWVSLSRNGSDADEPHVLNLNGGVLKAKRVVYEKGSGPAEVTFNGGTLEVTGNNNEFFNPNAHLTVQVGAKGGVIDAARNKYWLMGDIVSAVEDDPSTDEIETDGGLTLTGAGLAVLRGKLAYNGPTVIESSAVAVNAGYEFNGPLVIGAHGAIAVDISPVVDAAETPLAVGDEIDLFTVPNGLSFTEAEDSLATTVFLHGKAVGYEVFQEGTVVKARITDVSKIGTASAVTVFRADLTGEMDRHVDQDTAFNNGQPNDDRYDLVFFLDDGKMLIWGDNKNIHNRRMGQLVLRHALAWVTISNANFPNLDALRVSGVGTLRHSRIGFRLDNTADGACVLDSTVSLEVSNEGVSHTQDNWVGGDGATAPAVVNGDVIATNGVLRLYNGAVINGTIYCGSYDVASYADNDGVLINGGLVVSTGGTFDFKNHAIAIGENAKVVYDGGKVINFGTQSFPLVDVNSNVYLYKDLMKDSSTVITVKGGELTMPLELAEGYLPVKVQAGGVRFDVSDRTDIEAGTVLTLESFELAEGVTFDDITVAIVGSKFDWNVYVDEETGALKALAYESDSPNRWVGGPQGNYWEKGNWSHGIPTIDQTVEFDYDAVVCHNAKQDVFLEIGKLVLNGHRVSFELLNHDKQYWGAVRIGAFDENETGTLGLWRTGIWNKKSQNLDFPATMKLEVAGSSTDCWIHEDYAVVTVRCPVEILDPTTTFNLDYTVHLLGGLKGPGTVSGRQKSGNSGEDRRFIGGDWSEFTGRYNGNKDDRTDFQADFVGGTNSVWNFPQYFRLEKTEGTVVFGELITTADRHIEVQNGATVVIEIGGRDTDSTIGDNTCFYSNSAADWQGGWSQGSATATIRKVGTGRLTEGLVAAANLEAAEGTVAINKANDQLALTVGAGATVTANAADLTIGGATFEPGAQVLLASADAAQVHPLAVKGAVDVTGVKVALGEGVADALFTQEDPAEYTLLTSADKVTGNPDGEPVVVCSDGKFGWKAQAVGGDSLKLRRRNLKPGFMLLFR